MRILFVIALIAMAGTLFASYAEADNGPYGGVAISNVLYEEGSADLDMGATSGQIGMQFSDYFAVEGRFGTGMNSDNLYGITMDLENYYGVYGLFIIPFNQYVQPYGIFGWTRAEVTISHPDYGSNTDTGSGASLGFGIRAELNNHISIRIERIELISKDGYTVDETSLRADWAF